MKVSDIKVGKRHRKDLGDIDALAASIRDLTLLHPVVVTVEGELVAGERRLEAVKRLGWTEVPVTIATTIAGAAKAMRAERDENVCRKDFSPLEIDALATQLTELERPAAEARQRAGTPSVKLTEGGETRSKVAEAVGRSPTTVTKIQAVAQAAREHPAVYGDIAEEMDATDKIDPAYTKLADRSLKPGAPASLDSRT